MTGDYYELLGVTREATAVEIKKAFRRRARELHPDVNPDDANAEERFRNVTAAYEVLSDDERRAIYDRYGEDGLKQRHWEPQFASFGNISDIFSAFFGDDMFSGQAGGRQRTQAAHGENVLVSVQVDFAESALGTRRDIEFDAVAPCDECEGTGAAGDDGLITCEQCAGQGAVRTVARSLFGQVVQESICPQCGGRGKIVVKACGECHGTGEQPERRTLSVDIPAGISDGQRIRLTGRGSVGANGGPAGNLYIDVGVKSDDRFLREGDDLISAVELTFAEAALGCEKEVDTVDGTPQRVHFEAGTQPGEIISLQGRGVGRLRGTGRGDQRVVVNVQVPRELSAEQKAVLEQFLGLESERNYRSGEGLFDKLRRVLRT